MRYVIDTTIVNKLVDGTIDIDDLPEDVEFVATHVQIDELNKTRDIERRAQLFLRFATLAPEIVATETAVWDVSRWDQAKWSDGVLHGQLKSELDSLNGGKNNNVQDALIAEVAITNGFYLLTSDLHLAQVAQKHGCLVRHFPAPRTVVHS